MNQRLRQTIETRFVSLQVLNNSLLQGVHFFFYDVHHEKKKTKLENNLNTKVEEHVNKLC